MKSLTHVLMIMACFSILAKAEDAPAASDAKPKIEMETLTHDFGKIDKTQKVDAIFKFKNTGNAVLEIIDIKTSCGCTSAKPAKRNYDPGESGEVTVSFNPQNFYGPVTKRVSIISNDPENDRIQCTINADIVVDVNAKPRVLFFQNMKRGEVDTREILLSTERLASLEISDLQVNGDFAKVAMERVDDKNVKILVTVDGAKLDKAKKRDFCTVTYKTNSETDKDMKTQVHVSVQDPVEVRPPSIYFFGSKNGVEREVKAMVSTTVDKKVAISDIKITMTPESLTDQFKAEYIQEDEQGKGYIKIKFTPNSEEKVNFKGDLTFKTDVAEQPEVSIPLKGTITP
jgi:hypothetical protein